MHKLQYHLAASFFPSLVLAVFDRKGIILKGLANLVGDKQVDVVVYLDVDVLQLRLTQSGLFFEALHHLDGLGLELLAFVQLEVFWVINNGTVGVRAPRLLGVLASRLVGGHATLLQARCLTFDLYSAQGVLGLAELVLVDLLQRVQELQLFGYTSDPVILLQCTIQLDCHAITLSWLLLRV